MNFARVVSDWIAPEMVHRFAGSLLHFIWQGVVIAILAAIGLRLLRQRSPEARYAFAIASMVCMLAAPILTVTFYAQTGAIARLLIHAVNPAAGQPVASEVETSVWAQRILLTWCGGVLVFAIRLVVGWRLSWQLVKSAEQIVPVSVLKVFQDVKGRLGLQRAVRLLTHGRLDSPVVVGWLRPVVLLPISLISGFSEEQLVSILAHELAHI